MMSDNRKITYTAGGGIGLGTILFLIFLVLKLTGVIDWSWWLIFLPLVFPYIFATFVLLVVLGIITLSLKLNNRRYGRYF